ncbi:ABC transporter permease [Clostridium cochlearium]|uniref:ABC transporter permease n=1 Tax=Clostridium cochlearium TaxID=1494 RepID=UPI00156FEA85|nr:ABC transporter permease [Clostridium cochlearium]MBV1820122.1 ABC transporter permease [Bacteroidales bacterium MSK.15.36]MCG4580973.1 ABC transporter permease [Clostridium cochlearium]NSJ91764.1 ABC transporter permease [Coprococcus sp. MSK.21.13]
MKKLFSNCIYQGKNLFRDFGFSFWSLIYPLIMAVFFYTALNGILDMKLEDINVGINSENPIAYILEEIDFIKIHKITEDVIGEKLEKEEIDGFIDDDLNLLVKESGINQTIIKEVVEQIKQMKKLNRPIEKYDFSADYILNRNQKANPIIIMFYSLIAMVSTYGVFAGIQTVSLIQANLSNIGQRLNITPLKKSKFLLSGVIVALVLNLFSNGILLGFIKYVLKLNIFTEIKYSSILIIMGNLFGVALGVFIGSSNKKNDNVKTIIAIAITLILSFLSGMMSPGTKVMIDKKVPILSKINPISIITNNLYRINLLESTKSVGEGILILSIQSIILIFISYIFLRRKNYDSI